MKRYKALNNDGIVFAHAKSVALVCKHYLSKALTQLPRNIEDSAIAHLTPHFEFLFTVQFSLVKIEL